MSCPDDQAYNEAIQNPRLCFSDAELRAGTAATMKTGLPKVMSGNFASVYQIKCAERIWAVRCFRREITDQQSRYAAIDYHLRESSLPYIVGFDFLQEGIRVGARWYPVVKMEWITGQCLDQYVRQNLGRPDVLLSLAREWLTMTQALRQAQVAHGDLQHGNVLVTGGAIKLIDYDGMYVPALAGRPSNERGHANYQHPKRSDADFGPNLDAFSARVVFTSLLALSIAPYLWNMVNGGDEKLLFGRADFADPDQSPAVLALRRSGSTDLERLANELTASLRVPPRQVRTLDEICVPREQPRQDDPLPDWLRERVGVSAKESPGYSQADSTTTGQFGAAWLIDHLVKASSLAPVSIAGWLVVERLYTVLTALTVGACALATALGILSPGLAAGAAVSVFVVFLHTLIRRYRRLDAVAHKSAAAALLATARGQESEAKGTFEKFTGRLASEEAEYRGRIRAAERRLSEVRQQHITETSSVQSDANATMSRLSERRRRLLDNQTNEISLAESRTNQAISALTMEQANLQSAEKSERARVLTDIQRTHINTNLQQYRVALAPLRGIGAALSERLWDSGIVTAADVTYAKIRRVHGIGDQRARTIVKWREQLEARARTSMPSALPAGEEQRIRTSFAPRTQSISSQIAGHRRELENSKRNIQNRYQAELRQADAEIASASTRTVQQLSQLRAGFQGDEQRASMELRRISETYSADRRALDEERARLERALFQMRFALAQNEREFTRYRTIRFPSYVGRIFGFRRVG